MPPRPRSPSAEGKPALKRARRTLPAAEQAPQVSAPALDRYKLPDLPDSDIYYLDSFVAPETAQTWYDEMLALEGWYHPTLKLYGKAVTQSRSIAAYAKDPELVVKYSGQVVQMSSEYPPALLRIQELVEEQLGVRFNHVMLNRYDDGKVYIGNHRDNRENRVIASLSLGSPRTFIMTHDTYKAPPRTTKAAKLAQASLDPPPAESAGPVLRKKWILANGSLVVMQGDTQSHWKHEIPKEPKVKEGRISLTFRQLVF